MKKKKIILDLDTGIDDAVALIFGASLKNLDLRLITTVHGNVDLKQSTINTLTILEDINRSDIKVVMGEENPIEENNFSCNVHGKNGLGNYAHPIKMKVSRQNYLRAIHAEVKKNDMTYLIACGPMTNIAKYLENYPDDNSKVTIIMVTGLLNIDKNNPYLNFNIRKDQKACEIVLKLAKNLVIVPSDMGHIGYIPQKDFGKTEKCGKVGKILANMYPYHLDRTVKDGAAMHDLCGVLWLAHPEIFKTVDCHVSIQRVKNGAFLDFSINSHTNAKLTIDIDIKKMHKIYYKLLKSLK